ncbi:MAG: hypothetical protein AB7S68_34410, partial [Polyangiaceae bacterium]
MTLVPCPACHRHLRHTETVCRFCSAELKAPRATARSNAAGAAAAIALAAAAASVGCGGATPEPEAPPAVVP